MSKQDLKWVIQNMLSQKSHVSETKVVRRACVAAIIRWRPHLEALPSNLSSQPLATNATEFLNQSWINDCHGQAEMLFIERAVREGDNWSGQIAFPGGKNEASDKTDLDTVVRECKEEIGVHLDTRDFIPLGTLEHRNIKSLTTNTITMILIPFVFLQVAPVTPKLTIQVSEVSGTHWIPIRYLLSDPTEAYRPLAKVKAKDEHKYPWPKTIQVSGIPFPSAVNKSLEPAYLWGMTLRMTQEILGMPMSPHTALSAEDVKQYEIKKMSSI